MASGIPGGSGSPQGGQPQENLTESALSTGVKALASGLGKMGMNLITLGGAHAFEEGRKKEAQTQASLMDSMKQRVSRGESLEAEDFRAWEGAGGDPAAVAGLQRDAIGVQRQKAQAHDLLEQMHKGGGLNDNQYSMWAMALYSGDPTAVTLAQESIKSQAALMGVQMRVQGAKDIESSREKAGQERVDTQQTGAMARTQVTQAGAERRSQERNTTAMNLGRMRTAAQGNKQAAAMMKSGAGVSDIVGAASGDPGAIKKVLGPNATEMDSDTVQSAFANANQKLAETPGVSLERMAGEGAFALVHPDTTSFYEKSNAGKAYGVGLPGLIENAAKQGVYGITPEIAANFRAKWAAAMRQQDPTARAHELDAAIATIPDPDAQKQIYDQLQDMAEAVGGRAQSEQDEGDPAMQLLMGGDTDSGGDGSDTNDPSGTAADEKAADTDTGPGTGATVNDWEKP